MPPDPQELLFAWRVGYDALGLGEANHFQDAALRAAWEQGSAAARRKRLERTPPMTLQQVADEMGLTRERVRQIEQGALHKLRCYMRRLAG